MQLTEETVGPLTQDPVCGRHFTETQALQRAEHDGRTHLFCSERCRMLFTLRPDSIVVDEALPYSDLKPKSAATASWGSTSSAVWIVAGVTARVVRRGRGRTVEE